MTKAALSVERPVYPAGRAVHFFGAADEALAGRRFHVSGQRATTLRFGRLVLIVRYVDAAEWAPEELERKRADEPWLRGQAALQEAVLERAMLRGTVIPARLLAVYPHLDRLEDEARASYGRWRRALTRLAGKEEWTLSVFRGPHGVPDPAPYLLRATRRAGAARRPAPPQRRPRGGGAVAGDVAGRIAARDGGAPNPRAAARTQRVPGGVPRAVRPARRLPRGGRRMRRSGPRPVAVELRRRTTAAVYVRVRRYWLVNVPMIG